MSDTNILYQVNDGVAKIIINRPKVLNALRPKDLVDLKAAFENAAKNDDVGVIVLTGVGRAFCVGVDLSSLENQKIEGGRVGPLLDEPGNGLIHAIEEVPKAVIAMVNGYCITGGVEIALACDLIVASEKAQFADSHVKLGVRCSWGMSQRLPRRVGWLKAKELTFTAEMISGEEALRIGLINRLVPEDKLEETVQDLAKKIMRNSLPAIAAHKYLYNHGIAGTMVEGFELESRSEFVIGDTEERVLAFLEKK